MIYITSISPHTSSRHPQIWSRQRQTNRHHPDTPRHRRFYFLEGTGKKAISEQAWLLCIFTDIFGINTSPDTLRLYPDTFRHNPDTPRHRRFNAIQGTGRKDNIWVSWPNIMFYQQIWYYYIPKRSQTPSRHHPDTILTPTDIFPTPPDKGVFTFYVIQRTCPLHSALWYIKMLMSEGVLKVSGWCLDGASGCLEWMNTKSLCKMF